MILHAMSSNLAWSKYNAEFHLLYLQFRIAQFPDKPEPPVKEQLNYSIMSMKLQA